MVVVGLVIRVATGRSCVTLLEVVVKPFSVVIWEG